MAGSTRPDRRMADTIQVVPELVDRVTGIRRVAGPRCVPDLSGLTLCRCPGSMEERPPVGHRPARHRKRRHRIPEGRGQCLITTTNEVSGHRVDEVFGEVFGLTVRSRHVGSQMGAAFKSLAGGELKGMTKTSRRAAWKRRVG